MNLTMWQGLVAETQFATELTLTGLRRLCSVPVLSDQWPWSTWDLNYALHVGLHSYSSGLERLCKLTIACSGYASTGEFPALRGFSHKIGALLDAIEVLTPTATDASTPNTTYLARPVDDLDPELTNMVERFAGGAGRYEHLDLLWKDDAEVTTYDAWSALAARATVPEDVGRLIGLKGAMAEAIGSELIDVGLESTADAVMEDLAVPVYEPSVGVVLSLFRKARWVSTLLDDATYYTREDLPILGEVVSPLLRQSSAGFFNYGIARIGDDEAVVEELQAAFERIRAREAEMDDEQCGG